MASEAVDGSRLYSKVKRPSPYKPCGTEGKSVQFTSAGVTSRW